MSGFYIVFGSIKRPSDFFGGRTLDWSQPPIGVYQANSPEDACQAATKDHGQMATYFAVPGVPWGVDMVDAPAKQLGRSGGVQDRLDAVLTRMEDNDKIIKQLEQRSKRSKRELTPSERVAAAEAISRQMEREAGLDGE